MNVDEASSINETVRESVRKIVKEFENVANLPSPIEIKTPAVKMAMEDNTQVEMRIATENDRLLAITISKKVLMSPRDWARVVPVCLFLFVLLLFLVFMGCCSLELCSKDPPSPAPKEETQTSAK